MLNFQARYFRRYLFLASNCFCNLTSISAYAEQLLTLISDMRIGGSLWYDPSPGTSTLFEALAKDDGKAKSYWEEVASRGAILAVARRRAPRQAKEQASGRKLVDIEEENLDVAPADELSEELDTTSPDSDVSGRTGEEARSLFSEDSSRKEDLMKSTISFSDSEDQCSKSDVSFPSGSDLCPISDDEDLGCDPLEYACEHHGSCDLCRRHVLVHYHCAECVDHDICEECFDEGEWCNDSHPLTKRYSWGQQDGEVVRFEDLALAQELLVLDAESGDPELFLFCRRSEDLMLDSPPVIHPTEPLVVWLMSRNQLLFADFHSKSSLIHRVPLSALESKLSTQIRDCKLSLMTLHSAKDISELAYLQLRTLLTSYII